MSLSLFEYNPSHLKIGSVALCHTGRFLSYGIFNGVTKEGNALIRLRNDTFGNIQFLNFKDRYGKEIIIINSELLNILKFEEGNTFYQLEDRLNQPYRINDYILLAYGSSSPYQPWRTNCLFGKIIDISEENITMQNYERNIISINEIVDSLIINRHFIDKFMYYEMRMK